MKHTARILLGLALLGFAALVSVEAFRSASIAWTLWKGEHADAKIGAILSYPGSSSYRPVARFKDAMGGEHEVVLPALAAPATHKVGDTIAVVYPPGRPEQAIAEKAASVWIRPLLAGAAFLTFLISGAALILAELRRRRRLLWLRRHGTPIHADVVAIDTEPGGGGPWRIRAEWNDDATGRVHRFTSEELYSDPTPHIAAGRIVQVLIKPADPGHYLMDTSFLPSL